MQRALGSDSRYDWVRTKPGCGWTVPPTPPPRWLG